MRNALVRKKRVKVQIVIEMVKEKEEKNAPQM